MFAYKLKFILLSQIIAALNNCTCSLPPLANVKWSASLSNHVNPRMVKWRQWRASIFGSGDLISLPLLAHVCLSLVVEYWPFLGACGCDSHSKLYQCVILLLCFSLYTTHPPSCPFHPRPYRHWPKINNYMKKLLKSSKNQPLYICT